MKESHFAGGGVLCSLSRIPDLIHLTGNGGYQFISIATPQAHTPLHSISSYQGLVEMMVRYQKKWILLVESGLVENQSSFNLFWKI